jgi:hypothetical protein
VRRISDLFASLVPARRIILGRESALFFLVCARVDARAGKNLPFFPAWLVDKKSTVRKMAET